MEIVFSVTQETDGGFVAECLSHDIFTQADTWEELRANAREAVSTYFFDQPRPAAIHLHLVRDEVLATVEDQSEGVLTRQLGKPVAELRVTSPDPLKMHPELAAVILYDPTEPASEDEWPDALR